MSGFNHEFRIRTRKTSQQRLAQETQSIERAREEIYARLREINAVR